MERDGVGREFFSCGRALLRSPQAREEVALWRVVRGVGRERHVREVEAAQRQEQQRSES